MLALLFITLAPPAMAHGNTPIPTQAFFQHAQFRNVKISPDGKYLAVIGPVKGHEERSQVDIVDIATISVYTHYAFSNSVPSGIWWANNIQLLFTTAYQYGWYDHPVSTGYVWAMNIKSRNVDSIAYDNDIYRVLYRNQGRTGYVELGGGEFLEFDQDAKYAGDNKNARATHLLPCPGTPISAPASAEELTDRTGGYVYDDNAGYTRLWLGYNQLTYVPEMAYASPCDPQSRWYNISSFIASEPRYTAYGPWIFTSDNKQFYYAGLTADGTIGLFLVDPLTWKKSLLYADPGYDIDNLFNAENAWLVSGDGLSLLAFEYMADRPVWVLIDKSAPEAKLLEDLQKQFDGQNVMITSRTVDGSLSILFVSSDRNPGDYYLYETKSGKTIHLFKVLPGIDPDAMAPMQPIEFRARDGMMIHAYLTLPRGQSKHLPLIVLPHGGPIGIRDNWDFIPEVQFFAYHGYAVLQIEFRGSGGYGYAYQKAGYRQWGGAMQDDVTDGTRWAIQQGIADPKRICIYGASYGGYAAIEGVVKEPDLYQCAVGYAGVYDLVSFRSHFHTLHYQSEIPAITTELGDDQDYLQAHSPVFHVGRIKAALFLAHGGEDKTVPEEQADELRDALDKIHKPYEWLYYRNEGHGFYTLDHKVELYTKMLAFFDKHIGPQSATH